MEKLTFWPYEIEHYENVTPWEVPMAIRTEMRDSPETSSEQAI
ncbi:MAG: hypothetical protein P8O16_09690 [Algoriphagus sp.]|nr:hypothetical protein [Algoriphagus sp.]MDG1277540.1 hypothetical protein [Algoriphagus sp.]